MSEQINNRENEIAFYSPRSGEGVRRAVEILQHPPEYPLGDAEREKVLLFEHGLSAGRFTSPTGSELVCENPLTLQEVKEGLRYKSTYAEVTADYLLTPEGRADGLDKLGLGIPEDSTPADALETLRQFGFSADQKNLDKLAISSSKWAIAQTADSLVNGEVIDDFLSDKIFTSVDKLVDRLTALGQYRTFYAKVKQELGSIEADSREDKAKLAVLEIYQKVLNEELASVYPSALSAWDQLSTTDGEADKERLRAAWPQGEQIAHLSVDMRREYIVGLDRIRNGTALVDGEFSAISDDLRNLLESQELSETETDQAPRFTAEDAEKLASVYFNAEQMQAFCKTILAQLGLLSDEPETTYTRYRHKRAADGKWQVVITDQASSLEAGDPNGALLIPEDFYRSLTKVTAPVGAIAGGGHEITHIYQRDNLRSNQGGLELAGTLQGRSSLALREAGGIFSEQQIQQKLFGIVRPDAPHYMQALDAIEHGKSYQEAARYFYESYMQANPTESPVKAAKIAAERTRRLTRYGGFNSQPLNYAQSGLIVAEAQKLSPEQRSRLFAEGAFDLPDMIKLHRYGLLVSQPDDFPVDQFCDIVEQILRTNYLQQA